MKLRLPLLLCPLIALVQGLSPLEQPVEKRAISDYRSISRSEDVVEGSGTPPVEGRKKNLGAADIEWEASGVSPDDEDGDVDDGSGSIHDEVEGSGAVPPVRTPPVATPPTTSITQTPYVAVHEVERRPIEEDMRIEEQSTTTTTNPAVTRGSLPDMTTPPTSIFDEDRLVPVGINLKPGILAAVIGGVFVGILAAILLVMFVVYRMRKKDEGSYALDEPKQPPNYSYAYQKAPTKEFYA